MRGGIERLPTRPKPSWGLCADLIGGSGRAGAGFLLRSRACLRACMYEARGPAEWRANLGGAAVVDLRDERCRSKFFFLSVFLIPPRGREGLRVEGLAFFAGELGPL